MNSPSSPDAPVEQSELPLAFINGEAVLEVPKDLYIPPAALEVFLEAFEGPLDLLLYLIRKQNLDILDIDVAEISRQYIGYIDMMQTMEFELAAEYLLMASTLAEIKSRMLLPRHSEVDEDEDDPRAQLIRRLQEYERYKQAAEDIDALPRMERDVHAIELPLEQPEQEALKPALALNELMQALAEVLERADMFEQHQVTQEKISTRERMSQILERLQRADFIPFTQLFDVSEGRLGVVVSFLAIMELVKESLIDLVQSQDFAPLHVKLRAAGAYQGGQGNE